MPQIDIEMFVYDQWYLIIFQPMEQDEYCGPSSILYNYVSIKQ